MRVETPHPQRLVVRDRPWFVPALGALFCLLGVAQGIRGASGGWDANAVAGTVISIVLGGALALYTGRHAEFVFDFGESRFEWRWRRLLHSEIGRMDLAEVQRAEVQRGPETDDTTTRVVLRTRDVVLPLMVGFSAGEKHHRAVAEAINARLEAHRA